MINFISGILAIFGIAILIVCILILPFMWLWNWLIPELFTGPHISFWQSAGLLILIKMTFSNISIKSN